MMRSYTARSLAWISSSGQRANGRYVNPPEVWKDWTMRMFRLFVKNSRIARASGDDPG